MLQGNHMSQHKHQCRRDRWVDGLGWRCWDCDPAIVKAREIATEKFKQEMASRDRSALREYKTALADAKRLHPEWTLAQRQEYARKCAQSLFE